MHVAQSRSRRKKLNTLHENHLDIVHAASKIDYEMQRPNAVSLNMKNISHNQDLHEMYFSRPVKTLKKRYLNFNPTKLNQKMK